MNSANELYSVYTQYVCVLLRDIFKRFNISNFSQLESKVNRYDEEQQSICCGFDHILHNPQIFSSANASVSHHLQILSLSKMACSVQYIYMNTYGGQKVKMFTAHHLFSVLLMQVILVSKDSSL